MAESTCGSRRKAKCTSSRPIRIRGFRASRNLPWPRRPRADPTPSSSVKLWIWRCRDMRPEADPRPSLKKPLGCFLPFLPLHHLHNGQGKVERPGLRFTFLKCPDGNSVRIWEWVRNGLKFLPINTYALGFGVAHFLELHANFIHFDGLLAGG